MREEGYGGGGSLTSGTDRVDGDIEPVGTFDAVTGELRGSATSTWQTV